MFALGLSNRPGRRRPARQRGVALIITLLALVIMLIGAAALLRSFTSSQAMAGNLAFKRDLVNQAERASAVVLALFDTGALSTVAARSNHAVAQNYRAVMYTPMVAGETGCPANRVNAQGIPCVLLNATAFVGAGVATNDIVVADQGVTLRWIIDRLCNAEGSEITLGSGGCVVGPTPDARGGSASNINPATLQPQVLYRLSVRVDGPRNTQAYFQTTLAL